MLLNITEEVRAGVAAAQAELVDAVRTAVREELRRAEADPQRLVAVDEAARLVGMSAGAVRKAAERGTIPCRRVGRRLRFLVADLIALGERRAGAR